MILRDHFCYHGRQNAFTIVMIIMVLFLLNLKCMLRRKHFNNLMKSFQVVRRCWYRIEGRPGGANAEPNFISPAC
jgi:hypothetical protein